ncbi:hypothetical protein H5410_036582 [Solanum commersonii]|uniref:Uncharacterized protein n=1 Tax=Solanum commersonii TaxID=4109 RepID=A0A9J5Y8M0_SOLCO|nr:hypothetical protein H5410_036582 [Solanum commersonii]
MDDLPTFNAENMQNNMKVILYRLSCETDCNSITGIPNELEDRVTVSGVTLRIQFKKKRV